MNILGIFQNLNISRYLGKIERSVRNYFWAILGQWFMLVATVPTDTLDNSKAGPK
jgi:hypothetical protein